MDGDLTEMCCTCKVQPVSSDPGEADQCHACFAACVKEEMRRAYLKEAKPWMEESDD